MAERAGRWLAAFVLVVSVAAVAVSRPAAASTFDPSASVSSRSAKVTHAPRRAKGAAGVLGSGRRAPREANPIVGAFTGPVIGGSSTAGASPAAGLDETILGFDTRSEIFDTTYNPSRMVVLITQNGSHWCTGFLIGPSTVITAGHCVHPGGPGTDFYPAAGFRVYPAYNSDAVNAAPFGSCGVRATYTTAGWLANADDQYDYAAMALDCSVGNQTGWFGWWSQTTSLDGQVSKVIGYPGDKPEEQWKSRDEVRYTDVNRLFYANDTTGGSSGSPVFRVRGATEPMCQGPCVMAVHGYGTYGGWPYGSYNHGVRVTQDVSDNFFLWRNQ